MLLVTWKGKRIVKHVANVSGFWGEGLGGVVYILLHLKCRWATGILWMPGGCLEPKSSAACGSARESAVL